LFITIKTYKLCKYRTKTTTLILYITIDKTTKIGQNKNLAKKEKTHHPFFFLKQQLKHKGKKTLRGKTQKHPSYSNIIPYMLQQNNHTKP
jgi:hypothetical protein